MDATLPYNIYSKLNTLPSPCILFLDYNGWWAPLASLYYSTSSKVLVSRHPESCIEEIISFYCPQCTLRYADEEVQLYKNQCPACFSCPCCEVPLYVVALSDSVCCFQCGMCSWQSDVSNITGKDKHELEALVLAAERLDAAGDAFRDYISTLQGIDTKPAEVPATATRVRSGKWNFEQLEDQQATTHSTLEAQHRVNHLQPHLTAHDVSDFYSASDTSTISSSVHLTTLDQRLRSVRHQPALLSSLYPRRAALRTKRTLRCRKDVVEGKLSILVQPKTFPLEGDSSQKLQQGKWWVKDASAIHMIPRLAITKLPTFGKEGSYLHLTVTNYRDVDIIFSLFPAVEDIDASLRLRHPPFSTPPSPLKSTTPPPYFTLRANEDDLLRDDTSNSIPLFAEEVPDCWSVVYDHNIAKICVPVTLPLDTSKTAELEYVLYVKEFNSGVIPEEGLDSRSLDEIKNKSMRVVLKIVLPVDGNSEK